MELYYQGVDITEEVSITKAVHRDVSSGRCDALDLELDHAAAWYSWKPEIDDKIVLIHDGYSTGDLYLNTILPEEGKYRIIATSYPRAALRKRWASYEGMTLGNLFSNCAAECGMTGALYGISEGLQYTYLTRQNEGVAAFLDRLMKWEGAVLKTVQGRFAGISAAYVQEQDAAQTIEITADQPGVAYVKRENAKLDRLTVITPYGKATAEDADSSSGIDSTIATLPAMDNAQAGRWARGLLLMQNRRAEELSVGMEFNGGLSAMVRVDVDGETDASGEWIVDEVEHDFVNLRSTVKMLRCIYNVR